MFYPTFRLSLSLSLYIQIYMYIARQLVWILWVQAYYEINRHVVVPTGLSRAPIWKLASLWRLYFRLQDITFRRRLQNKAPLLQDLFIKRFTCSGSQFSSASHYFVYFQEEYRYVRQHSDVGLERCACALVSCFIVRDNVFVKLRRRSAYGMENCIYVTWIGVDHRTRNDLYGRLGIAVWSIAQAVQHYEET
jgi:hypothetical protein